MIDIEKQIVRKVIKDAIEAGFSLTVYDGEEYVLTGSRDSAAVLRAMFSTDEDTLYFRSVSKVGWVHFVYGNDGYDVISDHTTNLSDLLSGAMELADRLSQ